MKTTLKVQSGTKSNISCLRRYFTMYLLVSLLLCGVLSDAQQSASFGDANGLDDGGIYTNQWGVNIEGGREVADLVALDLGYRNLGQIGNLPDFYLFEKEGLAKRHKRSATHHTRSLESHSNIKWVEQQREVSRFKRDYELFNLPHQEERFNDIDWPKQWYLHDTREMGDIEQDDLPKLDLNIASVWDRNITGKGVVVTILDDGLEWNHTDLAQNYDPDASYDLNDDDPDPFPRYDPTNENKHGTRCGGEVAMQANNGKCGVGVAYDASIGGIRMLDGRVTDSLEAMALTQALDHIDIYSASWGPNDDGKTLEGPGVLAKAAFETGVQQGRNGKGAIYVWASGNGGIHEDNCDCDGYAGNIHTISISSASQHFKSPWYAERCASTMATTFSSGTLKDQEIVSTDLHDECTDSHTGTSASAPLAAGIFALVLQANPDLTWRDLQHLIAWTSEPAPFADNEGWKTNAAGFQVNTRFGFGLLNADALVSNAIGFETVPNKDECTIMSGIQGKRETQLPRDLSSGHEIDIFFESDGCSGQNNEINYLEHVEVFLDINYNKRGDLEIFLISPNGTEVMLLSKRSEDESEQGIKNWPFMTVHTWGENPNGIWKVKVVDSTSNSNLGSMQAAHLVLHGMKNIPAYYENGPRIYNPDYNTVQRSNAGNGDFKEVRLGTGKYGMKQMGELPVDELDSEAGYVDEFSPNDMMTSLLDRNAIFSDIDTPHNTYPEDSEKPSSKFIDSLAVELDNMLIDFDSNENQEFIRKVFPDIFNDDPYQDEDKRYKGAAYPYDINEQPTLQRKRFYFP